MDADLLVGPVIHRHQLNHSPSLSPRNTCSTACGPSRRSRYAWFLVDDKEIQPKLTEPGNGRRDPLEFAIFFKSQMVTSCDDSTILVRFKKS